MQYTVQVCMYTIVATYFATRTRTLMRPLLRERLGENYLFLAALKLMLCHVINLRRGFAGMQLLESRKPGESQQQYCRSDSARQQTEDLPSCHDATLVQDYSAEEASAVLVMRSSWWF